MKIIVLAGGLSTERDVSLSSGAGICRTLREKVHDAFLLDPFLGLPDAVDDLEAVFKRPDLASTGLSLPLVVKPCSGGSSIGVYFAHTEEEFDQAVRESFRYEDEIIIEEYIKGRELACGVIDGKALPVIEICPKNGWFDYANKYQDGMTEEICPARIPEETALRIQNIAEKAFKALKLDVYARADFLLTEDGSIYCLEYNSLPGMTAASLLPKEAKAAGIEFGDLCELLIEKSMDARYRG